ncbi:MAG: DUF4244 domain-containing protein [Nocardioidaceae bacterium]
MSRIKGEQGMATAEYAVGTVAVVAFGCVLCLLVPWIQDFLQSIMSIVLRQHGFGWFPWVR